MASSLLTTDRRWAAPTRKSGMTVLGKVPKPINLPSQRLENNGLDPNLEIVPKGTLTWGSKPTQTPPNAWGSSSILPTKNDGSSSSPSHLNGRPSSGGGSGPSTAGSESLSSPNAWGPNSRPSSASGTLPSPHLPMTTNRPRSAETRPGSSQLSRFADNASDNVKVSIRTIDRSDSTSHGHGFTLSTGDFPTLGSEKCSESSSQRGHSSKGRPTSSSGKEASQNEQGKSLAAGPGEIVSPTSNQPVDILKTNQQHAHTGGAPFPAASLPNEGQQPQPQPHPPNFHMPPQFDSWRAPLGNAPEGMWPRGAAPGGPYRPVGLPGRFPGEPFGYYGQFPPNSEAAARQGSGHGGYHPKSGDSYHPVPPNSYIMNQPVIPVRPVYQGPGPYDGYYGPRANFSNANIRDPHFIGGLCQPGILNHFPTQNDKFHHGHCQDRQDKHKIFPREQLESGRVQVLNRGQPRIFHDNPDRVGGSHEVEMSAQPAPPLLSHTDGNQTNFHMRTDKRDVFGDRNRVLTKLVPDQRGPAGINHLSAFDNAHSLPRDTVDGTLRKKFKEDNLGVLDQQPVIKKNAALIEKIESLNNKARIVGTCNVPEPDSSKEFKRLQKNTDSKSDQVMKDIPPTAVVAGIASASNKMDSVPHSTSALQRSPNVPTDGTVVGPLYSQISEFSKAGKVDDSNNDRVHKRGDSSRNSLHGPAKVRSANKFTGHGRGESSTTDSLPVTDLRNNNQHDQPPEGASQLQPAPITDDMPASLDYESQHEKMRELAVQRAKKLQDEEEERINNQKAKALAKLEELNMRSAVLQKKSNDTTVETDDGQNKQKAGLDVTAKLATSTAELCDANVPDSLITFHPPNDQHRMVLVQPRSTTLSHGTSVGKDPVADTASSSARNIQSNMEHVVQKSISQSHNTNVTKPKQGFRKRHVASEEKNPGEKPSVPIGTGNAKKNAESSFDTKIAVSASHDDPPALNKKGARHMRNKKKVEDAPITQHPPVVFNEQNASKASSEPKTYTGGVIISSSIVPTEGTIVTVGSITVGGISLPSLKQDCVKSSEGTPNIENNISRPQQGRRSVKHQHAVHPVEKPGNEGVSWAPVKQPEQNEQSDRAMPNTAVSDYTQLSGKSSNDGENITRIKRAEMERYVPKPLSKELQQQNLGPNLQLEETCADNKSHDMEAVEKSSDAKVDPATEPKKWEDKKASKGHGRSHPSWCRRNANESASATPNDIEQAENSHGSKEVQKSADQNQPVETDWQEIKQLKSHADTTAENSSATAETVPLPVSGAKEHSAANRQRRQHIKAQRNESKDREGREDIISQSATPATDSNSANHRNISRSDVKSSGPVSHSRAHWNPKSSSHSQGNIAVEGQVDSRGDMCESNSSKGSDSTTHQDSSGKPIKRSDGTDEKNAHNKQENLTREDGKLNKETHTSAEQQQVNPPVRRQGHHNGRYNRGDTHRGRGYDAGRQSHGTNAERQRGGGHLEYQPVGCYKPRDFQQNPSVDERTEGLASGSVFRERGHSRVPRPAGHFVKRNPASTSTTNAYQEE